MDMLIGTFFYFHRGNEFTFMHTDVHFDAGKDIEKDVVVDVDLLTHRHAYRERKGEI